MDIYKLLAITSPFISAGLAGLITYSFSIKGKRFDLLYQSKIPAFKALSVALINYKNYCLGRTAFYEGNEFSPYFEEGGGTLDHRSEIAKVVSLNNIYFSHPTRKAMDDLLGTMSGHCNAELYLASGRDMGDLGSSYFEMSESVENCISLLYKELNFKV
ncbi:hypothetical protein G6M26_41675 [Agrobacterium tumefaciens]|nr:hypothetical protein [Agrobacterium tumefaciens]NTE25058.1 hypothetical protein [Agrobacterium tumefaciens]